MNPTFISVIIHMGISFISIQIALKENEKSKLFNSSKRRSFSRVWTIWGLLNATLATYFMFVFVFQNLSKVI